MSLSPLRNAAANAPRAVRRIARASEPTVRAARATAFAEKELKAAISRVNLQVSDRVRTGYDDGLGWHHHLSQAIAETQAAIAALTLVGVDEAQPTGGRIAALEAVKALANGQASALGKMDAFFVSMRALPSDGPTATQRESLQKSVTDIAATLNEVMHRTRVISDQLQQPNGLDTDQLLARLYEQQGTEQQSRNQVERIMQLLELQA